MNRNFYKKMKNYKEIKGFIQNEYIRNAYMTELSEMPEPAFERYGYVGMKIYDMKKE